MAAEFENFALFSARLLIMSNQHNYARPAWQPPLHPLPPAPPPPPPSSSSFNNQFILPPQHQSQPGMPSPISHFPPPAHFQPHIPPPSTIPFVSNTSLPSHPQSSTDEPLFERKRRKKKLKMKDAEPISNEHGIRYPPDPNLRYRYPPPTPETLQNIANAIATVPKLYTQVLHLMNKMNLPPPFGPVQSESVPAMLKDTGLAISTNTPALQGFGKKRKEQDPLLSSGESELESEEEEEPAKKRERREPPTSTQSSSNDLFQSSSVPDTRRQFDLQRQQGVLKKDRRISGRGEILFGDESE
ncbi:uncharacterized protein VTP21DRAFT_4611 [Calcarisporiella thermophila]|uniref:uncharacterized protein n=1 Tax=Calcarisporiella thermophila TaxID=911321 RepID=UPI0037434C02